MESLQIVLLTTMKLYNSYIVASQSVKQDIISSAYMNEFISFNVYDKDYIAKKNDLTLENRP
mgnify:CR=1 FL=1